MKKIRINELARELEVKPNVILDMLPELGVDEKKTHSSSIDEDVALAIRKRLGLDDLPSGNGAHTAAETEAVPERTSAPAVIAPERDPTRYASAAAPGCRQPGSASARCSIHAGAAAPANPEPGAGRSRAAGVARRTPPSVPAEPRRPARRPASRPAEPGGARTPSAATTDSAQGHAGPAFAAARPTRSAAASFRSGSGPPDLSRSRSAPRSRPPDGSRTNASPDARHARPRHAPDRSAGTAPGAHHRPPPQDESRPGSRARGRGGQDQAWPAPAGELPAPADRSRDHHLGRHHGQGTGREARGKGQSRRQAAAGQEGLC